MVQLAKRNVEGQDTITPDIRTLVTELSSDRRQLRSHAREQLAEIGEPAVPALMQTLNSSDSQARWEAAKTLVEIGDPSEVSVMIKALEDGDGDIRWLAAEGLIGIGQPAVLPLLHALIQHSDSLWLRKGAHHILHALAQGDLNDILALVLIAMEDIEPVLEIPVAAHIASMQLMEIRQV